ncbi:MAG: flagellar motor switch protein FliG [Deltaproteobacteria bacterium]|nr:flagellar motor switch protein FliG [Deltaproteobacteria bacterium]
MDSNRMTGPEKAAVFLLSLGETEASQIFRKLSDSENKQVATVMASMENVSPDVADSVADEFVKRVESKDSLDVRGEAFFKKVVAKTFDKKIADKIFRTISTDKNGIPFEWSRDIDSNVLRDQIINEHPQTIAMILAHLPPEKSSEILGILPDDKKGDIAIRIVKLGQIPSEIIREVDSTLRHEMSQVDVATGTAVGGVDSVVDILNNLDRSSEEIIMETIEEEHAEMANEIREKMFVFEDLNAVDDRGMREILKKVENQQLALAMKTASEEMKQKILGNLSSRAAEMLLEDLEVMGPVRLIEVEEAQQVITRAAKELESDGTIVLGGKGKEDLLV